MVSLENMTDTGKTVIKETKKEPAMCKFYDISGMPVCKKILDCCGEISKKGKHVVALWSTRSGWGLKYTVMANVKDEFCEPGGKKSRSGKFVHQQYKWNYSHNLLMPTKGFEDFESSINMELTAELRHTIDSWGTKPVDTMEFKNN